VRQGHWTYAASQFLAERGLMSARENGADFSGRSPLTQYEIGVALLEALGNVDLILADIDAGRNHASRSSFDSSLARMSESDLRRASSELVRLTREYREVLTLLGREPAKVEARARALGAQAAQVRAWATQNQAIQVRGAESRRLTVADPGLPGLNYRVGDARVGVAYGPIDPAGFSRYAAGGSGPALSPTTLSRALELRDTDSYLGTRDLSVRGLRGSVAYGLTDDLSINLSYEEMMRAMPQGHPLDRASETTVGVGYRLSSSMQLKLRYHLIEYGPGSPVTERKADRLAEGEFSVAF
jgi:hypothetical protein